MRAEPSLDSIGHQRHVLPRAPESRYLLDEPTPQGFAGKPGRSAAPAGLLRGGYLAVRLAVAPLAVLSR